MKGTREKILPPVWHSVFLEPFGSRLCLISQPLFVAIDKIPEFRFTRVQTLSPSSFPWRWI